MYTKSQQLKKNKKPRRKKCKECGKLFIPERELQPCCSPLCEIKYISNPSNLKKQIEIGREKRKKEFKENNPNKTELREKVQKLAQKYGRMREISRGNDFCVTCGAKNCKFDGGHFLPKSKYTSIRYYTLQINPQCVNCNQYNGGRPLEYEAYMRKRFGDKKVDWLKSQERVSRKYTIEYYQKYLKIMGKRIKRFLD